MDGGSDTRVGLSPLFCAPEERRTLDDLLTARLDAALRRVAQGSVVPDQDTQRFRRELQAFDFDAARPLPDLLDWAIAALEHGVVHMTHPRYFGLFNPAPGYASECAERIVAAFNPQLASATTSPAAVAIEAHVLRAVGLRAGLREAKGHFTSGGSEANFAALTCALTNADASFADDGARAFAGRPTVYVSAEAHLAWYKILHQSGLGRASLRLIDTDPQGRIDTGALARAIAGDTARGHVPVMLVATAGTTGAGAIDPLAACAAIARDAGVWFHVDAAWGGALIAAEPRSTLLAGIERADSLTIDAHKWFATTMACGMFLTPHGSVLDRAFHVAPAAASFMPSNVAGRDPYVTSAQWSRRFLGLRLFLSLAAVGWDGYARHVAHAIGLASLLRDVLETQGWSVVNSSELAVLCVLPPPGFADPRAIADTVVSSGVAWVTTTMLRGQCALRVCITNGQTTRNDILILAGALHDAGRPNLSRSA
ncbi:pyridoxal phosphate-dependent decarboxylase family protein [Lichenicoccus sp.]|uniref:pyridoxal phosphate-dependent decarboxylase family protein n=1 Tax=Lichenicoccus sp. TaxID=2781899 RepID=UPI003D14D0EB